MAVAVLMEFEGTSASQYDEVLRLMGLVPQGPGPKGLLFHWAAATDTGFRVQDVWESREQFDRFAEEQIGPLTAKAGITTQPKTTYYEVYSYMTKG